MRIKITGTGRAVPAACVTSRVLDESLGLGHGQLEAATGVIERYVCGGVGDAGARLSRTVRRPYGKLTDSGGRYDGAIIGVSQMTLSTALP